jgi:hypothetical protein
MAPSPGGRASKPAWPDARRMGRLADPSEHCDPGNDQHLTASLTQEPRLEYRVRVGVIMDGMLQAAYAGICRQSRTHG